MISLIALLGDLAPKKRKLMRNEGRAFRMGNKLQVMRLNKEKFRLLDCYFPEY